MKAVTFELSLPRLAAAWVAGVFSPRGFVAPFGPLRLREVPEPTLPGEDWALVQPTVVGVCGSDVKQVFLDADVDNPLRALISFPHVLGHEVTGTVVAAGPGVRGVKEGDRVAVSPWLPCEVRGLPPCGACQRGDLALCEGFTEGGLAPGLHAGNCRDVPGGYGERMIAHRSMLFPVPQGVSDEAAALADPFAVALHAVRKAPPRPGETALVFGCGPLGLLAVHALARLYPETRTLAVDLHDYLRPFALRLGAHEYVQGTGAELLERVAALTGARLVRAPGLLPWLLGGVDRVYDTVGIAATLAAGLRVVKPRGTVVLVGVGTPRRYEWTPHFFREVAVIGSNAYGVDTFEGQRLHGFTHYLARCAEGRLEPEAIITHRFPLARYREALLTARVKEAAGAVKVVFDQRRGSGP